MRTSIILLNYQHYILQLLGQNIVSLDLLDDQLVISLDLLVAGAYNVLLIAAEHLLRCLYCLRTTMMFLNSIDFITCQRVTYLALNDILADSELVGWQENPWHHAPAVVAFHFDEKAGLNVLLHVLNSTFSKAFIVYFTSNQVPCSTLPLYLQAILTVLVVQILPSS